MSRRSQPRAPSTAADLGTRTPRLALSPCPSTQPQLPTWMMDECFHLSTLSNKLFSILDGEVETCVSIICFTHIFIPNLTCCRPNARMRGVAALNCHLLTPSTNVVASFLAHPLRLTHTAPPITATKFRKKHNSVDRRGASSSLSIFAGGSYQISCGFRPCQLKSSFFGDSLFPKIGIEINSLRDLQEAPSKSGGEG